MTTIPRAAALLAALALAPLLAGCGTAPPPTAPTPGPAVPTPEKPADPLAQARGSLRQSPSLEGCKAAVQAGNAWLDADPSARPAPLTPDERTALQKRWHLSDAETDEVASPRFTRFDAHYLEECLLFRDVARGLGIDALPPAERAVAAMAWVDRQVAPADTDSMLVPAGLTVRRAWGTPAERFGVAAALLRQLGLDPVLIGTRLPDGRNDVSAIGVLADGRVLVFAGPGGPAAGPDGKPMSLAELRAKAADPSFKPEGRLAASVTAIRDRSARLLPPLSALAPRMTALERLVEPIGRVRLSGVPAKPLGEAEAGGPAVRDGHPAEFADAALARFVPPSEGGFEPAPLPGEDPRPRQMRVLVEQLVPWGAFPVALDRNELPPQIGAKFQVPVVAAFTGLLVEPNQSRDLILRGRLGDAERLLVEQRDRGRQADRRLAADMPEIPEARRPAELERRAAAWLTRLKGAAAGVVRAQRSGDTSALAAAAGEMKAIETDSGAAFAGLLVERTTADLVAAELTWQLASCKHEEADRHERQARAGGPDAPDAERRADAWREAENWWVTWLRQYGRDAADADPARRQAALARLVHPSRVTQAAALATQARNRGK